MPGNSSRRGAVRKSGRAPTVGTGGHGRKALEGKGPTPKAEDRVWHKAYRKTTPGRPGQVGQRPTRRPTRPDKGSTEYVAGRNSVVEALRAEIPATALYVASRIDSDDRVKECLKIAGQRGLPLLEASRLDLDRLTGGAIHQGVALQVPPYSYVEITDLLERAAAAGVPPLLVVLDSVTDPRNLGAVIRSAAAFGAHGVVVPLRRAAGVTAGAWKSAAGAAARLPVARVANINRGLEELQRAGLFVIGLDAGGDLELPDLTLAGEPLAVVVGSEGKGLSRLVREHCDQVVSIPMEAATESLNAGVAASVALYEVARQRRLGTPPAG